VFHVGRSAKNRGPGPDPETGSDDNLGWASQARDHFDQRLWAPRTPVDEVWIRATSSENACRGEYDCDVELCSLLIFRPDHMT
jgi:hypothetical protein